MTIGFGDFVPGNSYIYNTSETVDEVSLVFDIMDQNMYLT